MSDRLLLSIWPGTEKRPGPLQGSTPGLRTCPSRNMASIMLGGWGNVSRDLSLQGCSPVPCSAHAGLAI